MYRNNNAQRKSVAPPCAHCRNLGLPTNHALRQSADPKSPVVCPVLKSTQCLKCGDLGHTASHCKGANEEAARLRNEAFMERVARIRAMEEKKQSKTASASTARPKTGGLFAALDDSDDEVDTLRISKKQAKKAAKAQEAKEAEAAAKAIESSREATRYLSALLGVGKKTTCFASGPCVTVTGTMTLTKQSLSQMIAQTPMKQVKVYKCWADAEEEDEDDNMSCLSDGDSYRNR